MKQTFKILLLILSISLVNCKKPVPFYEVVLENEPVIVRKLSDLPDYMKDDDFFYLELVNKHAKLSYTALNIAHTVNDGYDYADLDEVLGQYKKEDLAVKISGTVVVDNQLKSPYGVEFNGIYFHTVYIRSIEADE